MSNKFVIKPNYGSVSKSRKHWSQSWQAINEIIANSVDEWIKSETFYKSDLIVRIELDNNPRNLKQSSLGVDNLLV